MSDGPSPKTANAKPRPSRKKAKATVGIVAGKDVDKSCTVCDGTGWVCEAHPDRPFDGFSTRADACDCGAPGEPCQVCNDMNPPVLPRKNFTRAD
jgi:hypothetical protein